MAYVLKDRVAELTHTTGTGPIYLGGALRGFRTFASVFVAGDTLPYTIETPDQDEWEVGTATFQADGTLARTTVTASSNNNAVVRLGGGRKRVFCASTAASGTAAAADVVPVSSATALTFGLHNNKVLNLNPGATLSVAWANTGNGFGCIVINNTGADVLPTITGFTATMITHPYGFTKLASGGMSALLAVTPDGGTTRQLQAGGALA